MLNSLPFIVLHQIVLFLELKDVLNLSRATSSFLFRELKHPIYRREREIDTDVVIFKRQLDECLTFCCLPNFAFSNVD